MIRRFALVTVLAFLAVTFTVAASDVTFVLKNGERQSGQLVDVPNGLGLMINGSPKSFPYDDIAMVAYTSGDPSTSELAELPSGDHQAELDRHMLVLKNGEKLHGKLYALQPDKTVFDVKKDSGGPERREWSNNDIARLYLNASSARSVFKFNASSSSSSSSSGNEKTVTVEATKPWTDTGIDVNQGDKVTFVTTDKITVGPGIQTGASGDRSIKSNNMPVKDAGAGALIGRVGGTTNRVFGQAVGGGKVFVIGENANTITMPASGRLWIGVNDDKFTDNSGAFVVKIQK